MHYQPWPNCTAIRNGVPCDKLYNNGECNIECSNQECLYDAFECASPTEQCNPFYDTYCEEKYADGTCDRFCQTAECNWDGLDCLPMITHDYARGSLVIRVVMNGTMFQSKKNMLLRDLGIRLRTIVRIQIDDNEMERVYPYYFSTPQVFPNTRRRRRAADDVEGTEVYLNVDNAACTTGETACTHWDHTDYAAQMLAMDDVIDGDLGEDYNIDSVYCKYISVKKYIGRLSL